MSSSKARARKRALSEVTGIKSAPNSVWLSFFAAIIVFTVAMMVVSFPVGLYTVFRTPLSNNYSASTPVYSLTYDFSFSSVQIPFNGNLGEVFVLFLVIYLAFFLLAIKQGSGFLGALRDVTAKGYTALFSSPLVAVTVLLGATSLVTTLVDAIQSNAGVATGSLTGDPFALLVDFTLAPLTEETTFRLIMLGLPVVILSLIILRGFSPLKIGKALWRPSSVWEDRETETEDAAVSDESDPSMFPNNRSDSLRARTMKPIVYVFLALSSVMFGYAHFASGAGWGPGKISEAAIAGIALGYLYIKYGFHTNVLLHWSVNYVGSIYSFLAQGIYGVPWTSESGSYLDVIPTLDIAILLGIPSTLIVANELLKRAFSGK